MPTYLRLSCILPSYRSSLIALGVLGCCLPAFAELSQTHHYTILSAQDNANLPNDLSNASLPVADLPSVEPAINTDNPQTITDSNHTTKTKDQQATHPSSDDTPIDDTPIYNPPIYDTWLDDTRDDTKKWLNHTAYHIDDWFGTPNPDKPASASLRVMIDVHHDRYDGTSIEPRIRGRLKLPTLENRLSIIIGDDSLDNQRNTIGTANAPSDKPRIDGYDRQQSKENNSSLALRFSDWWQKRGVALDTDIGVRSGDDVYLRVGGQVPWKWQGLSGTLEQIYRYGSKSEHYARASHTLHLVKSPHRLLNNHTYTEYTQHSGEDILIGNSLYQTHFYPSFLGTKTLSYGINVTGKPSDGQTINSYGPFVHYRQPIWREWLFLQGEISYYNDKLENKDHHLASFMRIELRF